MASGLRSRKRTACSSSLLSTAALTGTNSSNRLEIVVKNNETGEEQRLATGATIPPGFSQVGKAAKRVAHNGEWIL